MLILLLSIASIESIAYKQFCIVIQKMSSVNFAKLTIYNISPQTKQVLPDPTYQRTYLP